MFGRHLGSCENVTPSRGSRGSLASSRGPESRPRPQAGPQAPQPAGLQILLERRLQRKGLRNQTLDRLTPHCSQGQTPARENLRDSGMIAQNYILNWAPGATGTIFPKPPTAPRASLCAAPGPAAPLQLLGGGGRRGGVALLLGCSTRGSGPKPARRRERRFS